MEKFTNMTYCPPNETLSVLWENHGLSPCSSTTYLTVIVSSWMLISGFSEWWVYRKYGTRLELREFPLKPLFFYQLLFTWTLILLIVAQPIILMTPVIQRPVSGYEIFAPLCKSAAWLWALYILRMERTMNLPAVPAGGHGLCLLVFWTGALIAETTNFLNVNSTEWFFRMTDTEQKIDFGLFVARYILTLLLFIIGLKAPGMPGIEEHLLAWNLPYTLQVRNVQRSSWSTFKNHCGRLLPFLWPRKSIKLQLYVIICLVILLMGRVLVPLAPIMLKTIVNGLSETAQHKKAFMWHDILIYSSVVFLAQGANSLFSNIRSFLWVGVQQFTTKKTQVDLYAHLHSLSLRWHLSRKTGEVLKVLDRGTSSVNSLLSSILFQIFPALADILIAFVYFSYAFNLWFGGIVLISMTVYAVSTFFITEWRTKFRREMNLLDNKAQARGVDALLNFETVKYYNAERTEIDIYAECISKYQKAEWKSLMSLSLLNLTQGLSTTAGVITGAIFCAYMVYKGDAGLTAGDFVLFITYMNQMYTPLGFLGTYYRMIQRSFIDMENMFELLDNQPEIEDHPGATELRLESGQIEFRDVHFAYESDRPILKNVSFVVPKGQTVALVGQTGSGKSTILRLLFRFYDVQSGAIMIDGQNIASVTQHSLRSHIGVVPQDTVLFNDSIRENIRYARPGATDDEVERAAIAADIHHSILRMPKQYETAVGERGLKLSGGEKQRVAIARTILKQPSIVILDEATSALDTHTERTIQKSLAGMAQGKTSIVVAHRLSTIVNANQIIVLEDGEIVEQGSHKELLSYGRKYAQMWDQQQIEERKLSESEAGPSGQMDEASTEDFKVDE